LYSPDDRVPSTSYAVLYAAITATCALQTLELSHIPVTNNERLLQLVADACKSAANVRLEFAGYASHYGNDWHSFAQVAEAFAHNTALISLQLTFFCDDPRDVVNLDNLLEALAGLQSFSLAFYRKHAAQCDAKLSIPRCIVNLSSLKHL
jgi:hypothetical protein